MESQHFDMYLCIWRQNQRVFCDENTKAVVLVYLNHPLLHYFTCSEQIFSSQSSSSLSENIDVLYNEPLSGILPLICWEDVLAADWFVDCDIVCDWLSLFDNCCWIPECSLFCESCGVGLLLNIEPMSVESCDSLLLHLYNDDCVLLLLRLVRLFPDNTLTDLKQNLNNSRKCTYWETFKAAYLLRIPNPYNKLDFTQSQT